MNRKTFTVFALLSVALLAVGTVLVGAGLIDLDTAVQGVALAETGAVVEMKALEKAVKDALAAMSDNVKRVQDVAEKAREEVRQEGSLHTKTNEKMTELGEATKAASAGIKELKDRFQDLEQKLARKPGDEGRGEKSIGQIVVESEEFREAAKTINTKPEMRGVIVGSFHKAALSGTAASTTGTTSTLVPVDRRGGIITPGLRRMTVRGLCSVRTTNSNMVEFVKENVYTNNAGPQYNVSPGESEGATKPESGITFTLAQVAVTTLAHWIPASRQILADAPGLQGYVDGRLRYGLMLEEEDELLNSAGANGELNGINNQATAFTGGTTNAKALDTLLKAFTQVTASEYDATGVILNPKDWQDILLLKDTTGRYLFADPHGMNAPMVWGKDVVATNSQAANTFTAGNFVLGCEIVDREDATVRVAEQHSDFFIRNMVVILAEERLAFCMLRPTAVIKGVLDYTG